MGLKKTLGLFDALNIGMGAIIGAGIIPGKIILLVIILELGISTVIYMLVSFTAIGLVGHEGLAESGSPLADAARSESNNAAFLISKGALAATLSVLLRTLLGLSRVSFAMTRNQDLPHLFTKLHPKRSVPYNAILVFGLMMTIFAVAGKTSVSSYVSCSRINNLCHVAVFPFTGRLDNR